MNSEVIHTEYKIPGFEHCLMICVSVTNADFGPTAIALEIATFKLMTRFCVPSGRSSHDP